MRAFFGHGPDRKPAADPVPSVRPTIAQATASDPIRLNGRYTLERVLGKGGEASVYAARDEALQRTVAVKLFHRRAAPPSQRALDAAEARVAASLGHYALTTLFDAGIDEGPDGTPQLYIVMEYVPGETLTSRLRRGPLSASEACWLAFDLAEGIDYMHQIGFVHRDVKPSNVLISGLRSVRPVVAKLTDFGIAAPVGEPDLSEFTVGTAAYLSPEQVEGRDAVPASDTYSLGLVLLEAMTGRVAFPGSVTESAFERLTRDPFIPTEIPSRTADLLRRMTARAPSDRIGLYETAIELQQILVDDLTSRRGDAGAASQPSPGAPELEVIGLQPSPSMDAAVRLAAAAAAAPRAVLLAFDDDAASRVVAAHGWSERPTEMETWPMRTERGAAPWVIPDLLEHPLLFAHPITRSPHDIRAVAGVPLLAMDGRAVGLLCVADDRPRAFSDEQTRALSDAVALLQQDLLLRAAVRRALFRED